MVRLWPSDEGTARCDRRHVSLIAHLFTPSAAASPCRCTSWKLDIPYSGALLAAGGEGRLLLWERAGGKLLAAFDNTHAEAVAQVGAHDKQPPGRAVQSSMLSMLRRIVAWPCDA